jgi:hypothetical protein
VTPPAPAAACDHPSPQSSRLRRPHLRPSRPLSLAEARELSCLGRVVVHPAVAAAVTKRGISARDAAIPADRSDVRIGRSMGVTQPGSSGDFSRTRAGSGSCGHDDVRRAGVYQGLDSLLSSPYACCVSLLKFTDGCLRLHSCGGGCARRRQRSCSFCSRSGNCSLQGWCFR